MRASIKFQTSQIVARHGRRGPMRRFLLFFAISMVPPALLAQSVPDDITITDNGSVFILAGNSLTVTAAEISVRRGLQWQSRYCVPSDGGKYDLGVIVSPGPSFQEVRGPGGDGQR